jgi:hypothetical protein
MTSSGERSMARRTSASRHCLVINTPTCGSTFAAFATLTCASTDSTLREQPPCDLYAAPLCHRQSAALAGLRQERLGSERLRRSGARERAVSGQGGVFPQVRRPRRGRRPNRGRWHPCTHRRDQFTALRAGDRRARDTRDVPSLRSVDLFILRVLRCVQPELSGINRGLARCEGRRLG